MNNAATTTKTTASKAGATNTKPTRAPRKARTAAKVAAILTPDVKEKIVRSVEADVNAAVAAADAEWESSPIPTAPVADSAVELNLDGMPFLEVMKLARPERDALQAWKDGGSKGKRPATPVLDWTSLNLQARPKSDRPARVPGEATTRTPQQQARLVEILKDLGPKWHQCAKQLTEEKIPTSRGGGWYYSTVAGLAKSLGIEGRNDS